LSLRLRLSIIIDQKLSQAQVYFRSVGYLPP